MPCSACKVECKLKMENILSHNNRTKTTGTQIQDELHRHGHPKCRVMPNGKQRTRDEAAEELASHYEYFHKINRPI